MPHHVHLRRGFGRRPGAHRPAAPAPPAALAAPAAPCTTCDPCRPCRPCCPCRPCRPYSLGWKWSRAATASTFLLLLALALARLQPPPPSLRLTPLLPLPLAQASIDIEDPPIKTTPSYPHHVFLMTRGTRGDVQPFVALARGLCSERGWLVTICTEARWKNWVIAQCADITAGAVRYLCSGGDSQALTETWISKEARACTCNMHIHEHDMNMSMHMHSPYMLSRARRGRGVTHCYVHAAYALPWFSDEPSAPARRAHHTFPAPHPSYLPYPPDLPRQIMGSKTEALQELMLAASEATFFASAPVFMHHLGQLQVRHRFFLFPPCNAM